MIASLPNVFFTVAPAAWRYVLPAGLVFDDSLSQQQGPLTLHLYHTMQALLEKHILNEGSLHDIGFAKGATLEPVIRIPVTGHAARSLPSPG